MNSMNSHSWKQQAPVVLKCIARFFARLRQRFLQRFLPMNAPNPIRNRAKNPPVFLLFSHFLSYILCWVCYWKKHPILYLILSFQDFFWLTKTPNISRTPVFLLKNTGTPLFCWFITQSLPNFADQTRTPASEVSLLGLSSVASACRIRRTRPCHAKHRWYAKWAKWGVSTCNWADRAWYLFFWGKKTSTVSKLIFLRQFAIFGGAALLQTHSCNACY